MKNKYFIFFLLLAIFIISGIIYRFSFKAYFFQDDWFSLKISAVETYYDFFKFFLPRTDVIYYRPLGMQIPFYILQTIFGIHPLPFHILTFLTHGINIFLVYQLINRLTKNTFSALLSAYLYGTSAVHYTPFYWSATYAFVLGPTAFFLSCLLLWSFLKTKNLSTYILSLLVFTSGLLINETVFVMPLIMGMVIVFIGKSTRPLRYLIPFLLPVVLLAFSRFYYFRPPTAGVYQLGVKSSLLSNLKAYLLFSFNWPEEMKAQFINFLKVNPLFIADFYNYYLVFVITLLLNLSVFFLLPYFFAALKKIKIPVSITVTGMLWFAAGLLPVIFFSDHVFSYYLPISLIGLIMIATDNYIRLINYLFYKKMYLSTERSL